MAGRETIVLPNKASFSLGCAFVCSGKGNVNPSGKKLSSCVSVGMSLDSIILHSKYGYIDIFLR